MTDRRKNVPQYDPGMVWNDAAHRLERMIIDADRLSLDGKLSREFEESFFLYISDARRLLVGLHTARSLVEEEETVRREKWKELDGLLTVLRNDLELLRTRRSP